MYTKLCTLENQNMARPVRIWDFISEADNKITVFRDMTPYGLANKYSFKCAGGTVIGPQIYSNLLPRKWR
jgi:hypothetical protein